MCTSNDESCVGSYGPCQQEILLRHVPSPGVQLKYGKNAGAQNNIWHAMHEWPTHEHANNHARS